MNPTRVLAATSLLLLAMGSLDRALAAWPNTPGVNVQVANTGNNQDGPLAVADGEGGAFLVWNEIGNIRAQHLTALGLVAPGWPSTGVVVTAASAAQYLTAATADGFGGFIAVWDDYRNADIDIYAQRIRADGSAAWTADGAVVCGMFGNQHSGQVCSDRQGGAVFVWSDLRYSGTQGMDVYAQRLSATGSLMWAGGAVAVCDAPQDQSFPSVVSDGTPGGSAFVWRDARTVGDANIYAQRFDADGYARPGWNYTGNVVCAAVGDQVSPGLVSDGAFGLIATWNDYRAGSPGVYAMRLTPSGTAAAGWAANGVGLSNAPFYQDNPRIVSDGAGGAIVTWIDLQAPDSDVFAQRVGPNGVPAWTAGGVQLVGAFGNQYGQFPVADGAGGALVAWYDTRAGSPAALYAQKVTSTGAIAPGWAADGVPITDHWVQSPSGCTDGMGGAIFSWQRNSPAPQTGFAQRIDTWGYLGVAPHIASVKDVPNDQGGQVKLSWNRSPLDVFPGGAIANYLVFRSVPPNLALEALASGTAMLSASGAEPGRRRAFVTSQLAGSTIYWEQLATLPAFQLAGYSYLAATEQDSVAGSIPRTLFMVRAQNADGSRYWLSDPDSAYSVDNLPPAAPAPLTGAYQAGATNLHWGANAEPDFALYRVYRGASAGFVPGAGNRIAELPDTGYVDPGPAGSWYKLTAVDSHGNESVVSVLAPSATLSVPGAGGAHVLALAPAFPSPSSGGTTCRFSLPAAGRARLEVFDASGRLVRALADATFPAGEHVASWDGLDAAGSRVHGGLYFVRLTFGGRQLGSRLVMLR